MMKVYLACDHGGVEYKNAVKSYLKQEGVIVEDLGVDQHESVDYPDYAEKVCSRVLDKEDAKGILICGTGIGMSIAANKIRGIRAALVSDCFSAKATREHNDTNVLCLGQRVIGEGLALMIVDVWLNTEFAGERHQTRIDKINRLEKNK
nr:MULTISPECIES: ribose 5-phosphate isomerase B [unclassified Enterococcus]